MTRFGQKCSDLRQIWRTVGVGARSGWFEVLVPLHESLSNCGGGNADRQILGSEAGLCELAGSFTYYDAGRRYSLAHQTIRERTCVAFFLIACSCLGIVIAARLPASNCTIDVAMSSGGN
jgi:hypothetical protein